MKPVRTFLRSAVSLLAITAWLAASNHCAVAGPAPAQVSSAPSHPGCHGHGAPHDDGKKQDKVECCKTFPPASVDAGKNLLTYDANLFVLQVYLEAAILWAETCHADLRPLELDTGPPFASSFAESVLQRSILAHAPPFLA